jgi:phosphatidylinositol 3-kinase
MFRMQKELLSQFTKLAKDIQSSKEPRPKKTERLRNYISDPKNKLRQFTEMALPLDPHIRINGIIPGKSFNIFYYINY